MIGIGRSFGRKVSALVTDMSQPLGSLVGNALEVIECIDVLQGGGPEDLVALCRELCAHGLLLGDAVADLDAGRELFRSQIASGRALAKFAEIVAAQGGDEAVIGDTSRLPRARYQKEVPAAEDACIGAMDTEKLGRAMCLLGAGRETMGSRVDPAVGMRLCKKVGDRVHAGEPLCVLYYNDPVRFGEAGRLVSEAFAYSTEGVERPALIRKTL
jgi:pyrimidine-nucleoside phosphorylase